MKFTALPKMLPADNLAAVTGLLALIVYLFMVTPGFFF